MEINTNKPDCRPGTIRDNKNMLGLQKERENLCH